MIRALAALALVLCVCLPAAAGAKDLRGYYGGRDFIVHQPDNLPDGGAHAMVVVLHGGGGNINLITHKRAESGLNINAAADKYGFLVAYLNGTQVARIMPHRMLGWNAGGGCCGMAAQRNVRDVDYIGKATTYIVNHFGVDAGRVYGLGHSNGAMMAVRMVCETNLFAAVVAVSGPLNTDTETCPMAQGKRVLAVHGTDDKFVPVKGGRGPESIANVDFKSEEHSQTVLRNAGAEYTLRLLPGIGHEIDDIDAYLKRSTGGGLDELAAGFFALNGK